jgi:glycosyltransferase involved in cell wall biosynthesis
MRIVIDLQGAQGASRHRGIGRYSLSLAKAMVRNRKDHEVLIALNGMFPDSIEPIRGAFDDLLPQSNIRVWEAAGPTNPHGAENGWRRRAAELIREAFLASLQPDVVHITSIFEGFYDDAVHTIGLLSNRFPTAVTAYDLIPLMQSQIYLDPDPGYASFYRERLGYLKQAKLFLAISESARREFIDELGISDDSVVSISAAAETYFKPIVVPASDRASLLSKFRLTRPFVMYSGAGDERKNHLRLIKAFSLLPESFRERFQLLIAGGLPANLHSKFLAHAKSCGLRSDEVIVTGSVSDNELLQLYNLCDLYVFPSWHEGFGLPALEAMCCGAAVIGSNTSSIPEVIGRADALFTPFDEAQISKKIWEVLADPEYRASLASHGLAQSKNFSWDKTGSWAIAALERFNISASPQRAARAMRSDGGELEADLIESIGNIAAPSSTASDWLTTAAAIANNRPCTTPRQLLVDVSELVRHDAKTGIQRVVRNVLSVLLASAPVGFIVEPVYASEDGSCYFYARNFARRASGDSATALFDDPLIAFAGDIFFGLDFQPILVPRHAAYYQKLRRRGVRVIFVIYDLLPLILPEAFPNGAAHTHDKWLRLVSEMDGAVCISRSVANEFVEWLNVFAMTRARPFHIGWFHLGANLIHSSARSGQSNDASQLLFELKSRTTFLQVGTIEPRKGYGLTLEAFQTLWASGVDVNVAFVGKQGWDVDPLVDKLRVHPERGRRLFWLEGCSDEYLEKIYEASACLIAPSEGEGFGLPLIEAAQYGMPIIARDIPVFREVAGEHAFYFSEASALGLATAIEKWLAAYKIGRAPLSDGMPWLTWEQSTQQLLNVILGDAWYCRWMRPTGYFFWGSDNRIETQVGRRIGRDMISTGEPGRLIFGLYISVSVGSYRVTIHGVLISSQGPRGRIDIVANQAKTVLAERALAPGTGGPHLAIIDFDITMPTSDLEVRVWIEKDVSVKVSLIEVIPLSATADGDVSADSRVSANETPSDEAYDD